MESKPTYLELEAEIASLRQQLNTIGFEKTYPSFFENNLAIILFLDPETGKIFFANSAAEKYYGYSKKQLMNMNIRDINLLTDEEIKAKFIEAKKEDKNYFIFKHKLASGEIRDVEIYQSKLNFNEKEVFVITVNDITTRLNTEREVVNTQKELSRLQRLSKSGLWELNIDSLILTLSPEINLLLGNKEVFTKQSLQEYVQKYVLKEDQKILNDELELGLLATNKNTFNSQFQYRTKPINGDSLIFNNYAFFKTKNTVSGIVFDITERKRTEKELRKSETRLNEAQQAAKMGSWELNLITNELYWSSEVFHLFDLDPQQFGATYEAFLENIHPEDRAFVDNAYTESLKTKKPYNITHRLLTKNGTIKYVNEHCTTFFNKKGEPIRSVGTVQDITEQKKIKENIKASEERYRGLSEASFEAIFISEKGICIEQNASAEKIFGYSSLEAVGKKGTDWIIPEDRELVMKHMLSGREDPYEATALRKDGTFLPVEIKARMMHYKGKDVRVTALSDITKRKLTEKELHQSEERFNLAMKASKDGLYDWNLINDEIYYSASWKEMLGYTDDELLNDISIWESLSHPNERDKSLLILEKAIAKKIDHYDVEFRMKHKLGHWVSILSRAQIVYDKKGNAIRAVGTHADLTKQKKAEQELVKAKEKAEENENRLNTFINSIPDIVCFKDGEGRWLLANQADLELFCLENVDYHNKTDAELADYTHKIYREAFLTCMVSDQEAWEEKKISHGIETIPSISGGNKVYDVIKIPIFHHDGSRKGLAVIGRDITELQNTQNNLLIAKDKAEESDRLKSAFLANMSHEIRTPMNGILGFSELLKEPGLNGDEQQEYIKIIERGGKRLLNIINDLIDISKIEADQVIVNISEVDINSHFEYLYTFFKPETDKKNLGLSFANLGQTKPVLIETDREKLYAILTNLLKNSIKYTDEGTIEFGYSLEKEGSKLSFFVKDTGIGIPKDKQRTIFERFVQVDSSLSSRYEGAGLGLAITQAYISMLGGKIGLQSEEGKGSMFYFTLPIK